MFYIVQFRDYKRLNDESNACQIALNEEKLILRRYHNEALEVGQLVFNFCINGTVHVIMLPFSSTGFLQIFAAEKNYIFLRQKIEVKGVRVPLWIVTL